MKLNRLSPTMEHRQQTDLRAQMPGIACDALQCLSCGPKQNVKHYCPVLERYGGNGFRDREYDMEVLAGKEMLLLRVEPARLCQ
jgi:hypothetical protein